MDNLLALVTAMAISMVLIPIMVRVAPRFGLIDRPNKRKVHVLPIPRVGGIGIVVGGFIPVLFLLPLDELTQAYALGALILFVVGIWDDMSEIGYMPKFAGQFIAALIVIFYGKLYIISFPFIPGGELSPVIGIPLTVVAIVGMINAVNLSDGLDGLAGGESLISLGAIALIAYLSGDIVAVTISLAVIGGILGFLRYNTHPARVFMGDSGSQFLGFTLGFLAIHLAQTIEPELSPAVVLLLLGLPIVDSLIVMYRRASSKRNMFLATRDHLHHQLLDLGFVHQESVVLIYSFQIVFVTSAVFLRYKNDWKIAVVYLSLCALGFGIIALAQKYGWIVKRQHVKQQGKLVTYEVLRKILVVVPRRFLAIGIPVYLIVSALAIESVPRDFAMMSLLVLVLMILDVLFGKDPRTIIRRALIYITAAFVGFLSINHSPEWMNYLEPLKTAFFTLIAVAFAAAVKFSPRRRKTEFNPTATDYLVVLCLIAMLIVSKGNLWGNEGIAFVVQIVVLFYGCELLISEKRKRWGSLSSAVLITVGILSLKGLLLA